MDLLTHSQSFGKFWLPKLSTVWHCLKIPTGQHWLFSWLDNRDFFLTGQQRLHWTTETLDNRDVILFSKYFFNFEFPAFAWDNKLTFFQNKNNICQSVCGLRGISISKNGFFCHTLVTKRLFFAWTESSAVFIRLEFFVQSVGLCRIHCHVGWIFSNQKLREIFGKLRETWENKAAVSRTV